MYDLDLSLHFQIISYVYHTNANVEIIACIVRLVSVFQFVTDQLFIIVEYCAYGSLKSYLQSCRCNGEVTESGCIIYKVQNESGKLESADDVTSTPYEAPMSSHAEDEDEETGHQRHDRHFAEEDL